MKKSWAPTAPIRPGPGAEERAALLVKSGSEVIAVVVLPGTALGVDRR